MKTSRRRPAGPDAPSVSPVFPLLLLETMRDMDRPDELLEGENLASSLPRRLGLSDVVYTQIHRFREETRKKSLQTPAVVEDLIRLVIRRPDADEIFEEAGRRMARLLPSGMAVMAAAKGARRLLAELAGAAEVEVEPKPVTIRLRGSIMTANADPGGAACAFYTGVLAELMTEYTGRKYAARHSRCHTRGGEACEWTTLVTG